MEPYQAVDFDDERIPLLLQQCARWCLWSLEKNPGGQLTKVPDQSTRELSACRTWAQVKPVKRWSEGGVGFVLTDGVKCQLGDITVHLLLIDLDACRDPKTGVVSPWAADVIKRCGNSYTEVSPSESGLRIAVVVKRLPTNIRAKVNIQQAAPPGVNKKPQLQLFGLGPAQYVTMTGRWLSDTDANVGVIEDLDWLVDILQMREPARNGLVAAVGRGPAPSLDAVAALLGTNDLIEGRWKKVLPGKSASEAYYLLVNQALQAANGHAAVATQFLLQKTAWGRGAIDDSADPGKYTRERWVEKEVARAAQKTPVQQQAVDLFDVVDAPPQAAAPVAVEEPEPGDDIDALADELLRDGPLQRLSTGLATLDLLTGGGFVLGSRVYGLGAPDAGKTALVVQMADHWLRMGIPVGILGVDEEPVDIASRLMQRRGISRAEFERRSPEVIAKLRADLKAVPLRLFNSDRTIEEAAHAMHKLACKLRPGVDRPACVLVIDSVQTARCKDEGDESLHKLVTQRVRQIKAAAARYRMLVVVTSEMNRNAYRSKKSEEQSADMAAAKESGAIEYGARVMFSLRNVADQNDVLELRVVKNKHGLSHRSDQDGIFLRVDRDGQQLTEDSGFEPVDTDQKKANEVSAVVVGDAALAVLVLQAAGEPLGVNELCAALGARGVGKARALVAKDWLASAGAVVAGAATNRKTPLSVVAEKVPSAVRTAMIDLELAGWSVVVPGVVQTTETTKKSQGK